MKSIWFVYFEIVRRWFHVVILYRSCGKGKHLIFCENLNSYEFPWSDILYFDATIIFDKKKLIKRSEFKMNRYTAIQRTSVRSRVKTVNARLVWDSSVRHCWFINTNTAFVSSVFWRWIAESPTIFSKPPCTVSWRAERYAWRFVCTLYANAQHPCLLEGAVCHWICKFVW